VWLKPEKPLLCLNIYEFLKQMEDQKIVVYERLQFLIQEKISQLKADLKSAEESGKADTKSSMGDKHETSREIVRQEIDFITARLNEAENMSAELNRINGSEIHETIRPGSLVETATSSFFISVAFGKIQVNDKTIYAISLASPAGTALKGKKSGENFEINGRKNSIISVA